MDGYKNIYKLIDGLNTKIKKLESVVNEKKKCDPDQLEYYVENTNKNFNAKNQTQVQSQTKSSILESYQIAHPTQTYSAKKYIGLLFDNNFNNFESDDIEKKSSLVPFIRLDKNKYTSKSNVIILYSISLELNFTPIDPFVCTIALGIKSNSNSNSKEPKIKILKGTKNMFDHTTNFIGKSYTITNTVIYSLGCDCEEELCLIADIGSFCKVNSKKSLIKILYL